MNYPQCHRCILIFLVCITTGCVIWDHPIEYNSFRAYTGIQKKHLNALDVECKPPARPKHFLLIHGIYGDAETFGKLPDFLSADNKYACARSVHVVTYWSSKLLPNFQRLRDLGDNFKERIREIAADSDDEIFIIAHSQGGLIARHAITGLATNPADKNILDHITLVMIGTPNLPSPYATLNNAFVNSFLFPVTYALAIPQMFINPFIDQNALIYNRQAYDMATTISVRDDKRMSGFMEQLSMEWTDVMYSNGRRVRPEMFSIVGVYNLFEELSLSDGVVHSTSSLYAGVPRENIYHVPYRHFGQEAYVTDKFHYTYQVLECIFSGGSSNLRLCAPKQRSSNKSIFTGNLSPFLGLGVAFVTFIQENSWQKHGKDNLITHPVIASADEDMTRVGQIQASNVSFHPVITLDEKAFAPELAGPSMKAKAPTRPFEGGIVNELVTAFRPWIEFVPTLLNSFGEVAVETLERRDTLRPKLNLLAGPYLVYAGERAGSVKVSREVKTIGLFGYETTTTENGVANFYVNDEPGVEQSRCTIRYPIVWGANGDHAESQRQTPYSVALVENSPNFIKVSLTENEAIFQNMTCNENVRGLASAALK